jgi:hypothetical protein
MLILFCSDPFEPRRPDDAWVGELDAARAAGADTAFVHWESVVQDDAAAAVAGVPAAEGEGVRALYRGWMLSLPRYEALFSALAARGVHLVTSPRAYATTHHLPSWYPALRDVTPQSRWLPKSELDLQAAVDLAAELGDTPLIVKDYVKSRKHEWDEACFIPKGNDREVARRVIECFLERQGDDLSGGLVLRRFVPLSVLGPHPKSGMPMSLEYRVFVADGRPVLTVPYWPEGEALQIGPAVVPPVDELTAAAKGVGSNFFTMDVALAEDGRWIVVELGDGQVAGLPRDEDAPAFYRELLRALG